MDSLVTQSGSPADFIESHPFAGIRLGDRASLTRRLTDRDIEIFVAMSGDGSPAQFDSLFAETRHFQKTVAPGMLVGSLISTLLETKCPGQTQKFLKPVHIGDTLTATATVTALDAASRRLRLHTVCVDQHGKVLIDREADLTEPADSLRADPLMADKTLRYDQLLNATKSLPKIRMGVVHPCSREALEGALEATRLGLIDALLIGPQARIHSLASESGLDLTGISIIDVPHSHAAADKAVELARAGEVDALMKGSLHSDELLGAVVNSQSGLRTERRISHVFVLDIPRYPKPLLITDAAINVAPDFDAKVDIVQNAIDLAHALGIELPKVAILSAVETVTSRLRSSMDAAALSKMADRGQITGGLVDGPLAFDNAVSLAAAKNKGIESQVAGDADILVVPDLESGNMLVKQLEYLGGAQAAGIVMGARVPIVLTSRADSAHSRIASCAITLLLINHRKKSLAKATA